MAAKKADAKKTSKKLVKNPAATATKTATKKTATKKATPVKKASATKTVVKKAPAAQKTVAKKAPAAKKTVAKKTPAEKKTVAKKAPAEKKTVAKKVASPKPTVMKKTPTKKTAAQTRVVAKTSTPTKAKAAAKKKPAAKKTMTAVASDSPAVDTDALLAQLANTTGLSADQVLARALASFATAHGFTASASQPAPVTLETSTPAKKPRQEKPSAQAVSSTEPEPFDDSHLPSLAPAVRLYVHAAGRIPQEMLNDTYIIGASPKCDLTLRYPQIEAQHLRIVREGSRYFAEDVGTTKGSIVHSEKVTRYEIQHEDDIFLAGFLKVRFYLVK